MFDRAGGFPVVPFAEIPEEHWSRWMDINDAGSPNSNKTVLGGVNGGAYTS